MTRYQVETGGKLYLTGEYAILIPGQRAIINYIPIKMTACIEPAPRISLTSDMFDYTVGMAPDKGYALVQSAIHTMAMFLQKKHCQLLPFRLTISGQLGEKGKKFGIGSSGSVVVLTLKALAAFYQLTLSDDLLFKLAAYTLLKNGDNGSMGDLACIICSDLIVYTSFDRQWLQEHIQVKSLEEILRLNWGYRIERLSPKLRTHFLVGWTQEPAISQHMVNQVRDQMTPTFLQASQLASDSCLAALQSANQTAFIKAITQLHQALQDLDPAIYHPALQRLVAIAQANGAVAKSSGSGGGDCGIAFAFDDDAAQAICKQWTEAGIQPLYQEKWGSL
ncbi:phosphomevalonate kinase [Streptococcus halichoeri]|uniref:phosphomevalonate kinase n=1 Tax=Streptococcus halichoeri TaxID=254785 RepID=UPI0013572180|nr:phosphomevalonate kinase [Streptococcus halichoeri]